MGDVAVAHDQFSARHLPSGGRGRRKHLAPGGTSHAHGMAAGGAHAGAAAGELQAHRLAQLQKGTIHRIDQGARNVHVAQQETLAQRVVGVLLMRRGFLHIHQVPIGVEFVRQHLREGGMDALPHLRMGHDGRDAVVRRDLQPHVEERLFAIRDQAAQPGRTMAGPDAHAHHQGAAGHHAGGDEPPAAPLAHALVGRCVRHCVSPPPPA